MSVLLCRPEKVSHPYFIENMGIHIYSSQELCYAIYHHPLLAMDDFFDSSLIAFIRDELDMGYTALKLERWLGSGENRDEMIFLFLQECNYYSSSEIGRLRQQVAALRKLPPLEYAKNKADYLFGFRQYGRAVAEYEKILDSFLIKKADSSFTGRVFNNLGACYARIFRFDKALRAYEKAYELLKDPSVLQRIYYLTLLRPDIRPKESCRSAMTDEQKAAWDEGFKQAKERAERSEEVGKVEELFARDPVRRMEGARQTLDTWKQEYRGMA